MCCSDAMDGFPVKWTIEGSRIRGEGFRGKDVCEMEISGKKAGVRAEQEII